MTKTLLSIFAAVALSAVAAAAVIHIGGPSTVELDDEIASTKATIAVAEAEAVRFSGGLILVQTQLRAAILKNTLAMLEQKRASFLRGITLKYQEPTPRISVPIDDTTAISELAKAKRDVETAQREAAMYSGGLLQSMALMREATAKTTETAIEQRIVLMKLGILLPDFAGNNLPVPKPPGKTTSDKNAL